jgi:hypothetical protein
VNTRGPHSGLTIWSPKAFLSLGVHPGSLFGGFGWLNFPTLFCHLHWLFPLWNLPSQVSGFALNSVTI